MQTVMRRFRAHHLAKISLVILVVVGLAALFAPVVAPYDPDAIVGTFSGAPCKEFILGTDQIGRDVFSRLLYATRISLLVGILATAVSYTHLQHGDRHNRCCIYEDRCNCVW